MGSLIMPHNIYLHSALVQSRQALSVSGDAAKREAMRYFGIESALSLTVSQSELLSSGVPSICPGRPFLPVCPCILASLHSRQARLFHPLGSMPSLFLLHMGWSSSLHFQTFPQSFPNPRAHS